MLRTRICSSAVATDVNRTDQVGGLFFLVVGDDVNTDGRGNTKRNWLLFVKWIGKESQIRLTVARISPSVYLCTATADRCAANSPDDKEVSRFYGRAKRF